ncbi:MAG: hypothetical protein KDA25_07150, partial [Phycisphaerales bacterium]|nr:hypothetical protein [Phycisphaerales bacterium]
MPIRLMLVLLALVAVPRDRSARAADDVWSLMSDDAAAFLVAQPLKRVSDQIQEQLQAMDRDELLLGGRPLDQLQGLVGIVSYVDDVRGGAVAWMPVPGGEPVPVFIVPATDPAKLLEANFVPGEAPNAYRLANGRTLFARIIGRDVLLSSDAAVVATYTP